MPRFFLCNNQGGEARQKGGQQLAADWKKIETDYMAGNLSYQKIAEKYGVSARQVEEHGRKNGWAEKRREFRGKVAARTEQKAVYKKSARAAERLAQVDEAAGLLLVQVLAALQRDERAVHRHRYKGGELDLSMVNGSNAFAVAKTLETLAGVIRDANDTPTKAEAARMSNARARLKLDKQKAGLDGQAKEEGGVIMLPEVEEGKKE